MFEGNYEDNFTPLFNANHLPTNPDGATFDEQPLLPSGKLMLEGAGLGIVPVRRFRIRANWKPGRKLRVVCLIATAVALVGVAGFAVASHSEAKSEEVVAPGADRPRAEGQAIVFSDAFAKRLGMTSIEVGRKSVVASLSVSGVVTFDPTHVARVAVRLRGVVQGVDRYEGATVKAGERLATLDSPELGAARASVATLDAENRVAVRHLEREEALANRQLTSARDVEEARATAERSSALLVAASQRVSALAGTNLSDAGIGRHVLSSPLSGTIIERHVAKGQLVEANHAAFLVANLDHLWVELLVFERSLAKVHVGDRVELRAEKTLDSRAVTGEIAQIGAVLNSSTRGATVRVRVDNHERVFRPGQSVHAIISAESSRENSAVTVPSSSIVYIDGKACVFVMKGPNSVAIAEVKLGPTNSQEVEIGSGLEVGQRVVVNGAIELRNELFR